MNYDGIKEIIEGGAVIGGAVVVAKIIAALVGLSL